MPDKKERDLWWAFLSGKPESVWNCPPRKSKKKNKAKQYRQFAEGKMRAWNDQEHDHGEHDDDHEGDHEDEVCHEGIQAERDVVKNDSETSNVARDEGEVENALKIEPQDSLPTPTGTPAPSDDIGFPKESGPSVSVIQEDAQEPPTPREPSPQLLKLIDEVTFPRTLVI